MDTFAEIKKVERLKDIPLADFIKKDGHIDHFMSKQIQEAKDKEKAININQLRNFFNEIKMLQTGKQEDNFNLGIARIEMNLAYDYGRNVINKEFYELTTALLQRVAEKIDFDNFYEIVKALIAYHKLHSVEFKQKGGK